MINLDIHTQPDDETCGPTCLHAIYQHYGYQIPLQQLIPQVERSLSGGTLAPLLGKHALSNNFEATIYINNINVFDPTWFYHGEARPTLIEKLTHQAQYKTDPAITQSIFAYRDFIQLGGRLRFHTVNVSLLKSYFNKNMPILTGLSATYLYQSARERFTDDGVSIYDDIRGTPCGHFVVLCGYDETKRHVIVADPHRENPLSQNNHYKVSSSRLINAIMLGVLTYDANLLVIQPKTSFIAQEKAS